MSEYCFLFSLVMVDCRARRSSVEDVRGRWFRTAATCWRSRDLTCISTRQVSCEPLEAEQPPADYGHATMPKQRIAPRRFQLPRYLRRNIE